MRDGVHVAVSVSDEGQGVPEQALNLNRLLQGHYAYFGVAGNFRALQRIGHAVERYWRKMLSSRSRKGHIPWDVFHQIKARHPADVTWAAHNAPFERAFLRRILIPIR